MDELKKPGFREFLIKTIIFVIVGITVSLFIYTTFRYSDFFKEHLTIPEELVLEKPNFRTTFLNSALFGLLAFILFSFKKLVKVKQYRYQKSQIILLAIAFSFIILQYLFKYLVNKNPEYFLQATIFWGIVKIAINIGFVIFLGLAIYGIPFVINFLKKFNKEIGLFSFFTIAFYFLIVTFQNLWLTFSTFISKILHFMLNLFFDKVTLTLNANPNGPILSLDKFMVVVGKPCSGIDSLLLFTSFFIIVFIIDRKRLNLPITALAFVIGVIGMFLTNVFRLFLLMIIGNYYSPQFAAGVFHSNVGWILFIIYGLFFWFFASKFIYKPEPKSKKQGSKKR